MDSFKLKVLMIILMVLDHMYTHISGMPIWFSYLGRIVAPIFAYLVVEGFFYTRSRKKYIIRLFGWGLVMFLGSYILKILLVQEHMIHNNIFLSLGMSVVLMSIIEWTKDTKKYSIGILGAVLAAGIGVFTEASIYGVLMTLIFYFLRDKKLYMSAAYIIMSLGINFIGGDVSYEQLFLFDSQWMMVFALLFILIYNGKRGFNNKFTKYMFYVFYPLHLWIIYVICCFF